ncbi:F-box protein PP2-B13-like [Lycium ferocissimum]|uniref:F-box protein PP2-B13-like n=1 Tax=Lycium ferocissimum TaxID=112874 RepID=UPI0028155FB7|nr:F-box protein PP2-B13-like [Lycium ferocissimum]
MLSPKTNYATYLVFKLVNHMFHGLDYANAIIRFVNYESDTETENQANTVKLSSGNIPKMRRDGWMEVELGYFGSKKGYDGLVEARLLEIKRLHYKGGLIVEGIEFCPKIIEYTSSDVDMVDLGF